MMDSQRIFDLLASANEAATPLISYRATVLCQDRIDGKLREQERIQTYFRRPGNVYLRWQKGPLEGLQASYVSTRDAKGTFQARETGLKGLAGTVTWNDDSPIVRKLYPHHFHTYQTNLVYLVGLASEMASRAKELGKFRAVEVRDLVDPWLKLPVVQTICELSPKEADGLRWPKVEFFFDAHTKFPLHFRLHAFDGGLFGEYAFADLEVNAQFSDDVFTIRKL